MSRVPDISDDEIEAARQRSPIEARNLERARKRMREASRAYEAVFTGLQADLAAANYRVDTVSELLDEFQRTNTPYRTAIPVLVKWLEIVEYEPLLRDIIGALSVPWAKPEASLPLVRMFTSAPPSLRWSLGNAIEMLGDSTIVDNLAAVAMDPLYGDARNPVIRALGKTKSRAIIPTLIRLLDDPEVADSAVLILGRLKATEARDSIRRLLDNPDPDLRKDAAKALARIG